MSNIISGRDLNVILDKLLLLSLFNIASTQSIHNHLPAKQGENLYAALQL